MWRFCSLFSSIAMAWCILNSCHKIERWIRNTTLKLCADCAKQFFWNAQKLWILQHDNASARTSMLVREFVAKNKTVIMLQPQYINRTWPPLTLFSSQNWRHRWKRFPRIEEIEEKLKQELLAISKSKLQKCFENWKKR